MLEPLPDLQRYPLELGEYRHYRGNKYRVHAVGSHSETLEPFVIYQALYGDGRYFVRPYSLFVDRISIDGNMIPRFQKLG